jgi:site-specific DNA-methyltransferase (adenine-specific)
VSVVIHNADMLTKLPELAAEGFRAHSVVCDPPYHLTSIVKRFGAVGAAPPTSSVYGRASSGFMGQQWDGGIAFRHETWAAVRGCMRPGAFIVSFSSSRTFGRMSVALEDAGFVTHPMLAWIFGSGFPKATRFQQPELDGWRYGAQALKPSMEPIYVGQNPLDGTGSQNWERHGCGGLNIDACRIDAGARPWRETRPNDQSEAARVAYGAGLAGSKAVADTDLGRWPANVLHDGSDEVERAFAAFPTHGAGHAREEPGGGLYDGSTGIGFAKDGSGIGAGLKGFRYGDSGSASRFFFCAKADVADRAGSKHPTVKPAALMRWLVQLVTPPGGTVLDPFAGTGSTGLAADQLGMDAVLIERDATYAADARRKIERDGGLFAEVKTNAPVRAAPVSQVADLFA